MMGLKMFENVGWATFFLIVYYSWNKFFLINFVRIEIGLEEINHAYTRIHP